VQVQVQVQVQLPIRGSFDCALRASLRMTAENQQQQ